MDGQLLLMILSLEYLLQQMQEYLTKTIDTIGEPHFGIFIQGIENGGEEM